MRPLAPPNPPHKGRDTETREPPDARQLLPCGEVRRGLFLFNYFSSFLASLLDEDAVVGVEDAAAVEGEVFGGN